MSGRKERNLLSEGPGSSPSSTQTASSSSSAALPEPQMFTEGRLLRNAGKPRPTTTKRVSRVDTIPFLPQECVSPLPAREDQRLKDSEEIERIFQQRQQSLPSTGTQSEAGLQTNSTYAAKPSSCRDLLPVEEDTSVCIAAESDIVESVASEIAEPSKDTSISPDRRSEEVMLPYVRKGRSSSALSTTHKKTKKGAPSADKEAPNDQTQQKSADTRSAAEIPARQHPFNFETPMNTKEQVKSTSESAKQVDISLTTKKSEEISQEPHAHEPLMDRNGGLRNAASASENESAAATTFAQGYSASPTQQPGSRMPAAPPGDQNSLRVASDARVVVRDPTGLAAPLGMHQKTYPGIFQQNEVNSIEDGTSTSEDPSAAGDSSSVSSASTESTRPSPTALKKRAKTAPPGLQVSPHHLRKEDSADVLSSAGRFSAPLSAATASGRIHQTAHLSSHVPKRSLALSSPKNGSAIDFGVEKAQSYKKNSSPKEEDSSYSSRRSTLERRSTMAPTPRDQSPVFVLSRQRYRVIDDHQRMGREQGFYLLAVCFAIGLTLGLIYILWSSMTPDTTPRNHTGRKRSSETCNTMNCGRYSRHLSDILAWADIRPCDDFFAFVCSRWSSRFTSATKYYPKSTDDDFVSFLEEKIHNLLRDAPGSGKVFQPLKNLHDECMNVRRIDDDGWQALNELILRFSLEGFPFSAPLRNISVWTTAAQVLRTTGTLALLRVSAASHPLKANEDVISIGPPELLSTSTHLESSEVARLYTEALFSAIKIMRKENMLPADVLAAARFASSIEKLAEETHEGRPAKLVPLDSRLDLREFAREVLRKQKAPFSNAVSSEVLIWPSHTTQAVLNLVAETEPHTVLNYLVVRLMIQVSPFMPHSTLLDLLIIFIYGRTRTAPPRWRLCVRVVERALGPLAYASVFAQPSIQIYMPSLVEFVNGTVAEFRLEIERSQLLDQQSKAVIRDTISTSAIRLIGPSWTNHTTSVKEYVDKLPQVRTVRWSLGTYTAYHEYTFLHALSHNSRERWGRTVFSTDCWYEPNPRTVYVPLLAFNATQALSDDNVDAFQLSRLGPRLSRCLFDMLLDETDATNGSAHWLTDATRTKLIAAESCFSGRRDYFRFGRFRDVLAARVAFKAFLKNVGAEGELVLRLGNGRVMTSAQVFFAFMMLQCCGNGEGLGHWMHAAAGHDLGAALKNSYEFRRAYNCSSTPGVNSPPDCTA